MIFPQVSAEEWCRRHGLEIGDSVCAACHRRIDDFIPYVTHAHVGLRSARCQCGEPEGEIRIYKGRTREAQQHINAIVTQLLQDKKGAK
jgi:hypothetical protein